MNWIYGDAATLILITGSLPFALIMTFNVWPSLSHSLKRQDVVQSTQREQWTSKASEPCYPNLKENHFTPGLLQSSYLL